MIVSHRPWIGPRFYDGLNGQRFLLFGFSHYGFYDEGGRDDDEFTNFVMERWALKGEIPFFNAVASYFGFVDVSDFYSRVAFANTLPNSVGDSDNKFSFGDEESRSAVEGRVRKIIFDVDADKAVVFTLKGWTLFPSYDDRDQDGILEVAETNSIHYGGYKRKSGGYTRTFGLRHPMMAPTQKMRAVVTAIMEA